MFGLFNNKRRGSGKKRSVRKSAKPGTWRSDPGKYIPNGRIADRGTPGKRLKPTNSTFTDNRARSEYTPVWCIDTYLERNKVGDEWKTERVDKTVISMDSYLTIIGDEYIHNIEECGNYVRTTMDEQERIVKREIVYGDRLGKKTSEYRFLDSADLKSFNIKR